MKFDVFMPNMVSGKNSITVTRTGLRFPTARFVAWRDEVVRQLVAHKNKAFQPFAKSMSCAIAYTPNDGRMRDVPGMVDAIYHSLERAQIVTNDGLIINLTWLTKPRAEEVHLEIFIVEIA